MWLAEVLAHGFLIAPIEPWALIGKPIEDCKECLPCSDGGIAGKDCEC